MQIGIWTEYINVSPTWKEYQSVFSEWAFGKRERLSQLHTELYSILHILLYANGLVRREPIILREKTKQKEIWGIWERSSGYQTPTRHPGCEWRTLRQRWGLWLGRHLQPLTMCHACHTHPECTSSFRERGESLTQFSRHAVLEFIIQLITIFQKQKKQSKSLYSWRNASVFLVAWHSVIKQVLKVLIKKSKYRQKFYELEKGLFFPTSFSIIKCVLFAYHPIWSDLKL